MVTVTALDGFSSMLCGEGPHWIEKDQSLVLVDIPAGYIYRYFSENGRIQRLKLDDLGYGSFTSLIIPLKGSTEQFVIAINNTLALVNWSARDPDHVLKKPVALASSDSGCHHRFNDGKADPQGRIWAGTMAFETTPGVVPPNKGALYRFGKDMNEKSMIRDLTIPNGLAWNSKRTRFFYIDSPEKNIAVYDYDDVTGNIRNKRILFDYVSNGLLDQVPDGMTIDAEDNLWVACWGGSQVICIETETGKLMTKVPIPSLQVTSCCFGGEDYSTLYVTSAANGLSHEEMQKTPLTGRVFKITGLGVKGLPPDEFVLDLSLLNV